LEGKMLTSKNFFAVLIILFFSHQIFAQAQSILRLTDIPFEFHKISDIRNGYTLQSNSSPQQLWLDLNNPGYLHAIFINSQYKTLWPDRNCLYFGSTDGGITWFQLGSVLDTSRSGFPSIAGTSDGIAVITNQSNYFAAPTRTGLFIDNGPFENNFVAYDPGIAEAAFWPKHIVLPDGNILIAALSDSLVINHFNTSSGTFSGWIAVGTSHPEAYTFSTSDEGKIGFAFIGDGVSDAGDVFYWETTNGGISWAPPIKVFDCPAEQGIAVGALRGINLNFFGEVPCVVFETCQYDFNTNAYFPRLPNQILFWSPNINGGIPKVIADENNVPFYPSLNPQDVFPPLCRPVIGRTEIEDYLFVAFSASTDDIYVGTDSLTYYSGYLTASTNGGEDWTEPFKFTPDSPLLDWKYISGPQVFPVDQTFPLVYTLHYVAQGDSLPGSPIPNFLTAQYYHTSFTNIPPSVEDEILSNTFLLKQNFPNPFNPVTHIQYVIGSGHLVSLKVYDVLGTEVSSLVKEEKPAGTYEVQFDAAKLPSGVYFYILKAGDFTQTKKMIFLR